MRGAWRNVMKDNLLDFYASLHSLSYNQMRWTLYQKAKDSYGYPQEYTVF